MSAAIDVERTADDEDHPVLKRAFEQLGISVPLGERCPDKEASLWRRPGEAGSQPGADRTCHDIPLVPIEIAQTRCEPIGNAQSERLVDDMLVEDPRREVR
jgi:hypothetical protein